MVSSYRINNGPTTIFNATETAGYQFQQKLFQSARLNESVPHTLVVTLVNNGTFFIDYFLVVPVGVTSASASSSNPTALTTVSSADSSTTAGAGLQSHSRLSVGPVVGGTLGGVALLMIAILAVLLCWRRKDKDQKRQWKFSLPVSTDLPLTFLSSIDYSQSQVDPFITSALSNQQHQPHEGSERVSEHQSLHPTLAPTSSSGVIPSSKAARLPNPSHRGDSLHSRQLSDSIEPPRYNE